MFPEEILICCRVFQQNTSKNCDMEGKVKRFNLKIRVFFLSGPVVVEGGWGGIVFRFLSGFENPPIYFCFQENQINPIKQPGLQACFS